MKLSKAGADLIKSFEGCHKKNGDRFEAYLCPAKVPTIGWGHTNDHGRQFAMNAGWTQQECDDEFAKDMVGFENAVTKMVKVPLKQHQYDALVSFAFNAGAGNLRGSTLLRKLNAGDYDGAAAQFLKWVYGGGKVLPGLVRRRAAESLMFQGVPDRNYDGKPDSPQGSALR
jgi:lysozyme